MNTITFTCPHCGETSEQTVALATADTLEISDITMQVFDYTDGHAANYTTFSFGGWSRPEGS